MKLRNLILAAVAVAASSTVFADNTGAMAQGGTYVGLAGGWGKIISDPPRDLFDTISSTTEGGFSGRVYFGYLMSTGISSNWMFGPEVGYSHYANNTDNGSFGDFENFENKETGYGIDFLLNATYMLNDRFNLNIKPGVQYASQKVTVTDTGFFPFDHSANDNKIIPEVNLGANWQAFAGKPFFLGASYQYAWGNEGTAVNTDSGKVSVTSREMFSLNLEYMFH